MVKVILWGMGCVTLLLLLIFHYLINTPFEAATGEIIPDLQIWYTPEMLYRQMGNYTIDGWQLYRYFRWLDTFFPLIYGGALWLLLRQLKGVVWLAGIVVCFDYWENISLQIIGNQFPEQIPFVATGANIAGSLKGGGVIVVLGYMIYLMFQKRKELNQTLKIDKMKG